jgi:hypothetical protein
MWRATLCGEILRRGWAEDDSQRAEKCVLRDCSPAMKRGGSSNIDKLPELLRRSPETRRWSASIFLRPSSIKMQDEAWWAKPRRRSVPRYFFTIRGRDRVKDDPRGTNLPDFTPALSNAERKIRELRKESGYNDPTLMMIVKDEAGRTVLSLPFFPGH